MKYTTSLLSLLAISIIPSVLAYGYDDEPPRKCTKTISKTKWITSKVTKPVYVTRTVMFAKTTTVTVTATAGGGGKPGDEEEEDGDA
ncbi:hypothetical protein TWF506_002570 [Arthrobotrys conoides]|uniref:Uncharacterized protein n=1 Tax=Arthrobotrys conoides TaxID=74498 RepID=A0AAN8RT26_9PEZI